MRTHTLKWTFMAGIAMTISAGIFASTVDDADSRPERSRTQVTTASEEASVATQAPVDSTAVVSGAAVTRPVRTPAAALLDPALEFQGGMAGLGLTLEKPGQTPTMSTVEQCVRTRVVEALLWTYRILNERGRFSKEPLKNNYNKIQKNFSQFLVE